VIGAWKRLVYANRNADASVVDHRAYTFCVLKHLHRRLNRRDVFAKGLDRWGDRRTRLIDDDSGERAKGRGLMAVQLLEAGGLPLVRPSLFSEAAMPFPRLRSEAVAPRAVR
jgi:hypothetical protein